MAIDWLATLDVKRAVANCYTDIRGDWYRDPWGWPELSWMQDLQPAISCSTGSIQVVYAGLPDWMWQRKTSPLAPPWSWIQWTASPIKL
jgi:hypothetical protein